MLADFAVKNLNAHSGRKKVWAVGERINARLQDAGIQPEGMFNVPDSVNAITPLASQILIECKTYFENDENAGLYIFHNRPEYGAIYRQSVRRLLPLDEAWKNNIIEKSWPTKYIPEVMNQGANTLLALIHEYLFVSLFRASAESLASENASRLAAMQRAEKNIDELLEDLNRNFHRLRQSSIDEELFDVISGFEALSGKR